MQCVHGTALVAATHLHGRAQRHNLIRVDRDVGLLLGQLPDQLDDGRDACGTTHQDDLLDVAEAQLGILQGSLHWTPAHRGAAVHGEHMRSARAMPA
jgi:hypothetical protein